MATRKLTIDQAEAMVRDLIGLKQLHVEHIVAIDEKIKEIIVQVHMDVNTEAARGAMLEATEAINKIKDKK